MLPLLNKNLVVVDLETSGVNPFRNDILSIGLIPLQKDSIGKVIYVKHSDIEWSQYAKRNFSRFETEWRSQAIEPKLACKEIEQYLHDTFGSDPVTPIGHNVGFDVAFLRKLAFQAGQDEIGGLSHRAIDTHTLLYMLFLKGEIPASALKSDGAFQYFGITITEAERHTALGDAKATQELLWKILEKFELI